VGSTAFHDRRKNWLKNKGFGRWSSICSAIVCWALIAAE
jgi:hypothetical protein